MRFNPKQLARTRRASTQPAHIEAMEPRRLLSAVVDVRLPDGGKAINIAGLKNNQVITLEIWATVKGKNSSSADDALQSLIGSFTSTNVSGGAVRGDLGASIRGPFNAMASNVGNAVDLDGDGDRDIGSKNPGSPDGFFAVRSSLLNRAGLAVAGGRSYHVGDLSFTVFQLMQTGTAGQGATEINFRPRAWSTQGVWMEDGICLIGNGGLSAGTPLVIKRTAAAPAPVTPTKAAATPFSSKAIDRVHAAVDR